jgi:hypothetical protein
LTTIEDVLEAILAVFEEASCQLEHPHPTPSRQRRGEVAHNLMAVGGCEPSPCDKDFFLISPGIAEKFKGWQKIWLKNKIIMKC